MKTRLWTGRILSAIPVVFLLIDAAMKLMRARVSVEASVQLGYPENVVFGIGLLLLGCNSADLCLWARSC
jgi:hypothetical protein